MYRSEQFGRHFWVDDNLDLLSCPTNNDLTADIANWDYVSEWDDWSEVNVPLLLNIQKACILNKTNYHNSLSLSDSYVREVI